MLFDKEQKINTIMKQEQSDSMMIDKEDGDKNNEEMILECPTPTE